MHYLVATDSVHTTAAACDYLEERLDAADRVDVLTVVEPVDPESGPGGRSPLDPDAGARDAGDAANVAAVRLAGRATVETLTREGPPAQTVLSVVAERGHDVVLVGTHAGRPRSGPGLGSVARAVLEGCDRPVVVLPLPPSEP